MRKALRDARLAAGLTQRELASRVGLDRTMLVRIEKGTRRASVDLAVRIADALKRPVEELFLPSEASDGHKARATAVGGG